MRLADIIPGPAFRLALKVSGFSLVIISLVCVLIYNIVTQAMLYELKVQSKEEVSLLSDILKDDGSEGLIKALGGLSKTYVSTGNIVGVFDTLDKPVAGNISVAPDFVGWKKTALTLLKPMPYGEEHQYHTKIIRMQGYTLIVGRSDKLISAVQQKLIYSLVIGSLIITLATLILGALSSSSSARKIRHMDRVLKQVSGGDIDTRIALKSVSHPDQFDQLALRINQHLDTLSELMTGIKSTASAVAHDLKTPLSHTQFSLYDALELCEKGQNPIPVIESAIGEIDAINATFDTILRISRINAQLDRSHFQLFDLSLVTEKITELFEPVYEEINNQIRLEKESEVNMVFGDAGMIEQLLVNLLKNIQVHCATGTRVIVRLINCAKGVSIIVQDDGPGIIEEEMENVLKPFHRVDKARTESGNGLGLTLIAAIAHHHKASLMLENSNPGLRVTVFFPTQPLIT